jgi:hypothetical protein
LALLADFSDVIRRRQLAIQEGLRTLLLVGTAGRADRVVQDHSVPSLMLAAKRAPSARRSTATSSSPCSASVMPKLEVNLVGGYGDARVELGARRVKRPGGIDR